MLRSSQTNTEMGKIIKIYFYCNNTKRLYFGDNLLFIFYYMQMLRKIIGRKTTNKNLFQNHVIVVAMEKQKTYTNNQLANNWTLQYGSILINWALFEFQTLTFEKSHKKNPRTI